MRRRTYLYLALALFMIALLLAMPLLAHGQTPDPRTPNARAFHVTNGLVDGVELQYREHANTPYQLVQARLIDEAAAGGNTVATFTVIDCNSVPVSTNVYLAWPWPNLGGGRGLPGNQNNQHMIANGYSPPAIGPLAIYIDVNNDGVPDSDEIGGLGLPFNRHVSFYLAFHERCGPPPTPVPVVTPTPAPVSCDLAPLLQKDDQILTILRAIAAWLHVPGY